MRDVKIFYNPTPECELCMHAPLPHTEHGFQPHNTDEGTSHLISEIKLRSVTIIPEPNVFLFFCG